MTHSPLRLWGGRVLGFNGILSATRWSIGDSIGLTHQGARGQRFNGVTPGWKHRRRVGGSRHQVFETNGWSIFLKAKLQQLGKPHGFLVPVVFCLKSGGIPVEQNEPKKFRSDPDFEGFFDDSF